MAPTNPATRALIFIPTYNEQDDARRMCEQIHQLGLDADVLFVDDSSPDGTGEILEALRSRFPRLVVQHRPRRLGVGSAHLQAINWAYGQGYSALITMDCDFTHSPADIPALLAAAQHCDASVGSRWVRPGSLPGWNVFRRFMTRMGRWLTRRLLRIPQDASGAFRCYRLDRLPRQLFQVIKSNGYSFFYESLFILNRNGFSVAEVPIVLPARTYKNSKMSRLAALQGALYAFEIWFANQRRPEQFLLERLQPEVNPQLMDPQDWDAYWSARSYRPQTIYEGSLYELIAGVYRRGVIKPNLNRLIRQAFPPGSELLHAGCGSGQVDAELQQTMRITAFDISAGALRLYARNNWKAVALKHGSIFELPFANAVFDGIYNLGVMEHFTREEIGRILAEFRRVLKPGGKLVLFWPHARATSVVVLRGVHFVRHRFFRKPATLHPAEINLCRGRRWAGDLFAESGFELLTYEFGPRDFFVQARIVALHP
jgi:dolichol-phosphate mannosyltransferase